MNSVELREALQQRVKEITFGYVPNDQDTDSLLWCDSILIIQRKPDNLKWHRVCVNRSGKISIPALREMVAQQWSLGDRGMA